LLIYENIRRHLLLINHGQENKKDRNT